ncbi:MAG: thioredoxin domain-containing protein [Desulfovibrionaceae bacterium]|nr:thioredoxin domain-containing protein [Desulfovibrionaceae bacterium]
MTTDNADFVIREILREHPDIVLQVLREHSEEVLDIAQQGSLKRRHNALSAQWKREQKQPIPQFALHGRPIFGSESAPVTIVGFSDFTCSYCKQAHDLIMELLQTYSGQIRYVMKLFPLNSEGSGGLAAEYYTAASLQDPDKAKALYMMLFAQQNDVLREGKKALDRISREIGLDMRRLSVDMRSRTVREMLDADLADAALANVEGTPHMMINALTVKGALSKELVEEAISMALEATRKK